jgi:SAM-dependent methyltransferase
MNDEQREGVRSNAKYLRQVRPIDPEEIHEYVQGQPHPAAVKQVLREEAVDLGLLERDDGTFEPVDAGPIESSFDGVSAFPAEYGMALEELLVEAYGPGWPEGESGDELRETIRRLKTDYLYQNPVEYDRETALAYACYHLPDYYAAVQYVLATLLEDGLLPNRLRVLDVGAGVGGPALGLHDLVPDEALVDYHAVEPSEATEVLDAMLAETGRNFHTTVHETTAESFDPAGAVGADETFDLVLFGNVLSELADPATVVERYGEWVADDGTVVGLAPADRNTAINLRTVERAVADDGPFSVYAPTVRLWPNERPTDEGWSFDVAPDIDVPAFQRQLDDSASDADHEAGEFVSVDVQYAYSLLRVDGSRRIEFVPDASRFAKMADMEDHVTDRIDLVGIKLSHNLAADDDANPLFKVGDGSESTAHYAVLTKDSALNSALVTADYGFLLVFENVLALWNDDEEAYNLVVDGETVVDAVPAGR